MTGLQGLRALRGGLLELAVAFVLGLAFAAVVTAFVEDVVMNVVAAVARKPDFTELTFSIGDGVIRYVRSVECGMPSKPEERQDCPHCLGSAPAGASVCQLCTRDLLRRAAAQTA